MAGTSLEETFRENAGGGFCFQYETFAPGVDGGWTTFIATAAAAVAVLAAARARARARLLRLIDRDLGFICAFR